MSYYLLEKELRNYFNVLVFATFVLWICLISLMVCFFITFHFVFAIFLVLFAIVTIAGTVSIPLCYKAYYKRIDIVDGNIKVFLRNKYQYSIDLEQVRKSIVNVRFVEGKYNTIKKCMVIHSGNSLVKNNMKFYWNKRDLLYVQEPELIECLNDNKKEDGSVSSVEK